MNRQAKVGNYRLLKALADDDPLLKLPGLDELGVAKSLGLHCKVLFWL